MASFSRIFRVFSLSRRMGVAFELNEIYEEKAGLNEMVKKMAEELEGLKSGGAAEASSSFAVTTQDGCQSLNP